MNDSKMCVIFGEFCDFGIGGVDIRPELTFCLAHLVFDCGYTDFVITNFSIFCEQCKTFLSGIRDINVICMDKSKNHKYQNYKFNRHKNISDFFESIYEKEYCELINQCESALFYVNPNQQTTLSNLLEYAKQKKKNIKNFFK